jgi:hypothetical protein
MFEFTIRTRMVRSDGEKEEPVNAEVIVVGCLVVVALVHSVLGEARILRPLLGSAWSIGMSRRAAEQILRFAWHLTSIAWLALAAIVAGGEPLLLVAIMALWSAGVIFVMLRAHLAWPLFLLAGLAALRADGSLDSAWLRAGAIATAVALLVAAALHVYWAGGGRWMLDRAAPATGRSGRRFQPGPVPTLLVAVALAGLAALIIAVAEGRGPSALRWLVGAGAGALALRAVGDTRVAGFTKTVRDTPFARADDRWFTPLVVFLALGTLGALTI